MKIKPCKKCGSTDVKLYDCGYPTFNVGGGECRGCGSHATDSCLSYIPKRDTLIKIWNEWQKPNDADKLKAERKKTRKLRKQLKTAGIIPSA